MAAVTHTLPDDLEALKALIVKERAEREQEVHSLRQQLNTIIEALHLEPADHYPNRCREKPVHMMQATAVATVATR